MALIRTGKEETVTDIASGSNEQGFKAMQIRVGLKRIIDIFNGLLRHRIFLFLLDQNPCSL